MSPSAWGIVPGSSRSAPEQKPLPAPVMITTRTSLSSPIARRVSRKGTMTSKAMAFIRSGRFNVTRATWGCGVATSTNDMAGIVGRRRGGRLCGSMLRLGRFVLGQPAQAGRSGVPGVDDGRAGEEIVQGPALALEEDAQEPEPQEQEAQGQRQSAHDGLAWCDPIALCGDHLNPEHGHAERLAAHGPGVGEIDELPDDQRDDRRQSDGG